MRLLQAQISNYRTHRLLELDFPPGLLLIHGPNESGKSTIVEALHRVLFLNSKGTAKIYEGMASDHGGTPKVSLRFSSGASIHRITKEFGSKGWTKLETEGSGPSLTGEAAEKELSRILASETAISGRGAESALPRRWAHLWVWQGSSPLSPIDGIAESTPLLQKNLQARSGLEVIISPRDLLVLNAVQAKAEQYFSKATGKSIKSSPVSKLETEVAAAEADLQSCEQAMKRLEEAAQRRLQAAEQQKRLVERQKKARQQLIEVNQNLAKVAKDEEALAAILALRDKLARELERANTDDQNIQLQRSQLAEAEKNLVPDEKHLKALAATLDDLRKNALENATNRETAAAKTSSLRTIEKIRRAQRGIIESLSKLEARKQELAQFESSKRELSEARQKQASLKEFEPSKVRELSKLGSEISKLSSQLENQSVQVELLSAEVGPILLDQQSLSLGSPVYLAESADLYLGDRPILRISPGGRHDLDKTRDRLRELTNSRSAKLEALGVQSLEQVELKGLDFQAATVRLSTLEGAFKHERGTNLEQEIETITLALQAHQRDARIPPDLAEAIGGLHVPSDLPSAVNLLEEAQKALTTAEDQEGLMSSLEKNSRKERDEAEKNLETARTALQQKREEASALKQRLTALLEHQGDDATRRKRIEELQNQLLQTTENEQKLRDNLRSLGKEALELDRQRLTETIDKATADATQVRDQLVESETLLASEGTIDPELRVREARANLERLQARLEKEIRYANSLKFLQTCLENARSSIVGQLGKPLEESTNEYLECLFGPGPRASVSWTTEGARLESLFVDRSKLASDSRTFDDFSYGTREQIALAFRLAMAGILAESFDGCLPIILDDAFTHSDTKRHQALERVLYKASQNGLQVIIFTCHPDRYGSLAASEIPLGLAAAPLHQ